VSSPAIVVDHESAAMRKVMLYYLFVCVHFLRCVLEISALNAHCFGFGLFVKMMKMVDAQTGNTSELPKQKLEINPDHRYYPSPFFTFFGDLIYSC
jgi:hypothetical protein